MMIVMMFGASGGFGVWLLIRAAQTVPMPLQKAIASIEQPRWPEVVPTLPRWVPRPVLELASANGLRGGFGSSLEQDLAILDRHVEAHALARVKGALLAATAAIVAWAMASALDACLPAAPVAIFALALGAAGWCLADSRLRQRANARRREFSSALSTYLDLVSISLAGGAGTEQALTDAARVGNGWSFQLLQRVLADAQLTQRAPWRALGETAEAMDLAPLLELAAAMTLAGESGARTRESLAAKAESLRNHELTQIESEAAAATEKMGAPVAFLVIGFVALIGYPALATIMQL